MQPPANNFEFGSPRIPMYAPGMSQKMLQDPMGLVVAMFGMPLLQGLAGPGSFMPQLTPGQALGDQHVAAQYQLATMAASLATSQVGNKAVDERALGLMSMALGVKPSELNKEQISQITKMANHPVTKMVLGQMVGADNLEAMYFGRHGDPAALASAVSRVGFFRQDPLGGKRMSAESMAGYTQALHANLYGEEANVDDMRGFMAGQVGQLHEHLFQRGMLPQSIGALSAAERADVINSQMRKPAPTDEAGSRRYNAAMDRLTKEFATRDLTESERMFSIGDSPNKYRFSQLTDRQKEEVLAAEAPNYRQRLETTLSRIQDVRDKDNRARSPAEMEKELAQLERTGEYGVLARNVDASKTANKLKEFTGAVAAVREIFGDNGNGNAPFPALLAALEHLSQGSISQVGAGKVENTLRSMRLAARDAGIGFEQLAGMSAEIGAYGDTLGIARPISMQNTLNAAIMTKAMRDTGQFDRPGFGKIDQATAAREAAMRMQRGDASPVGMTLAAMARMVKDNPTQFAEGSMVKEMVDAYKANNPTFEVGGKTYNLAEIAGKGGNTALADIVAREGGNIDTLRMYALDPRTQEDMQAGFSMQTQGFQLQRDINNMVVRNDISAAMQNQQAQEALAAAGVQDDEEFTFSDQLGAKLVKRIAEETADMSSDEAITHLQKNLETDLASMFDDADEETRLGKARGLIPLIFGDDPREQRAMLGRTISAANVYSSRATGLQLPALHQLYNNETRAKTAEEQAVIKDRADRLSQMSRGRESSLIQRFGEEIAAYGRGEEVDFKRMGERITGSLKIAGMRDDYAPEFATAFAAIAETMGASERVMLDKEASDDDRKKAKENAALAVDVAKAMHSGNDEEAIKTAAGKIAERQTKLNGPAGGALKDDITAASLGDEAALKRLEKQAANENIDATDYEYVRGLHTARKLAKGPTKFVLGDQFMDKAGVEYQKFQQMEQAEREEAIRRAHFSDMGAATASGKAEDPQQNQRTMFDSVMDTLFGRQNPPADKPQQQGAQPRQATAGKTDTANMTARTVQLAAETVTLQTKSEQDERGLVSKTLKAEDISLPELASVASSAAAKQESRPSLSDVALNGTLTIRGMQEAVLNALGEAPMPTAGGPPIMNPHV